MSDKTNCYRESCPIQLTELFGCRVFGDDAMRAHLPPKVYDSLKATSSQGKPLDPKIADVVANSMKEWAISQGATHYTHWFQPLSNITAGKHDSFLSLTRDSKVVSEFSSSALVKGEPDASSFPSGGLRNTFEARGYTAWDPSSPAFVRDGTLYIPTAFCSYTGEALDTKTPLLRSMQALAPQALRVLKALGHQGARSVMPTVGAEQEYFLVDRDTYEQRLDLKLCGRTLLGAKPPKGQELDDHYCGRLRLRVSAFMQDLDEQLWSLGVPSKTKHNEAAPAQHELAPIFEVANVACDHNLLTMEMLRITAKKHGLACLLHEKPFAGVNGSGKHNNYSIVTDDGVNFLNPGKHPEENLLFLVTLCALIESVDTYADLLRLATAVPGNDYRLGGNEAPPAIISIFLGKPLTDILTSIARGISPENYRDKSAVPPGPLPPAVREIDTGVDILPHVKKDDSDRNRTSPFAFTGNKFEFRMLGSSQSIAFCNAVLNTAVAEVFSRFADRLEQCEDQEWAVGKIIADTLKHHGKVIFNGNNYSQEWVEEAGRRGLPILNSSLHSIRCMSADKNVRLFEEHGVFTPLECHARQEIMTEHFAKVISIEAETLLQMVRRQIFPAALDYLGELAGGYNAVTAAGMRNDSMERHLQNLSQLVDCVGKGCDTLENAFHSLPDECELDLRADLIERTIRPLMEALRRACDQLESGMPMDRWPIPTYNDLLYRI